MLSILSAFAQPKPREVWEKKHGSTKTDAFYSVLQNDQGNLIAVGTATNEGKKGKNKDMLFARINPENGLLLENCQYFGEEEGDDVAYRVIQTLKGDMLLWVVVSLKERIVMLC